MLNDFSSLSDSEKKDAFVGEQDSVDGTDPEKSRDNSFHYNEGWGPFGSRNGGACRRKEGSLL